MKSINAITTVLIIIFNLGMGAKIAAKAISIMHSGNDDGEVRDKLKTLKNSIFAFIIVLVASGAGIVFLSYFSTSIGTA